MRFHYLQGIESFDHNKNLNILVTGSLDHMVRIWNPYVPSKPMAVLQGHATGVIGVKIHEGLVQVFSYSKDAVSLIGVLYHYNVKSLEHKIYSINCYGYCSSFS